MHLKVAQTRNLHSRKAAGSIAKPPLIGRSAILDRLVASDARMLVLVGEPGIGKTRLLAELHVATGSRDDRCVSISCLQANQAIPFEPLIALARGIWRRCRVTEAQLRNFVDSRGIDRLWYFRELIEAAVRDAPLTLQIDDAQWADAESMEAILCTVDRLGDSPLQWHIAMRSGYSQLHRRFEKLASSGTARIERLEPLTKDETTELARAILPAEVQARLKPQALWADSGGNPLYVEHCAHAATADRRLARGSLRQLFEDRIGAVSSAATDICSWLAVAGRPTPPPTLAALTGLSVSGAELLLEELEDAGLVALGDGGAEFRHALIREACYGLLDDAGRRQRHEALVPYAENDWHRVNHLDGSGRLTEAAVAYNALGWRHIDSAEPERAHAAFLNALQRVSAADAIAAEARAGRAVALVWLGRTADAMRAWQDFQLARTSPSDTIFVTANVRLAEAAWENGEDVETALPVLQTALESAADLAPHLLPRILLLLGAILERRGDLSTAQAFLERGLCAAESVANSRDALRLRSWLAVVKARRGDPAGGVAMLEGVVERAEALQYPNDVAQACVKLCYLADMTGDNEQYAVWCRRGLRDNGPASIYLRGLLMTNLASVETDVGNLREALAYSVAAERLTSALGGNLVIRALCQQAMLHATMGSFAAADDCLTRTKQHRQRASESWQRALKYARAVVDELRGDIVSARALYASTQVGLDGAARTEVFDLRSLAGMVRTACRLGDLDDAVSSLALLRAVCNPGWVIADSLLAEAEGHVAIAQGNTNEGCAKLMEARKTARYRVRDLELAATVAEAQKDRRELAKCIAALQRIEALGVAAEFRTRARALGMRPGSMRPRVGLLTDREIDVARYVACGKSNGEIARLINVTRRTVEFHVANIFRKLDLNSRVELTALMATGAVSGAQLNGT
jgi:DNA-binding NarL/FixJ family response regulator